MKKLFLLSALLFCFTNTQAQDWLFFDFPYSYSKNADVPIITSDQFLGSGHRFVANFTESNHLFLVTVYLPITGGQFQVQLSNINNFTTSRYTPTIDGLETTDTSWFTYAPTTGGNLDIITFYMFNQDNGDPHIRQYIVNIHTNKGKVNLVMNQNPY